MKKSFMLVAAILVFAFVAAAQDVPKFETFLGYTYVRFSAGSNLTSLVDGTLIDNGGSFNANGGSGQFVWNFSKWLGAVADLGAVHNTGFTGLSALDFNGLTGPIDATQAFYLFGPRFSVHKWSRFKPYAQVLFGGAYNTSSARIDVLAADVLPANGIAPITPGEAITARVRANQNAFAMTVGGGIDIKISKHVAVRPVGLDYYMTRLQNFRGLGDDQQNNLRYTAGINFMFGAR